MTIVFKEETGPTEWPNYVCSCNPFWVKYRFKGEKRYKVAVGTSAAYILFSEDSSITWANLDFIKENYTFEGYLSPRETVTFSGL